MHGPLLNNQVREQKFKNDGNVSVACQDSGYEFKVLLFVSLVELRTPNILVGSDLMCEMYYTYRDSYVNCHGVLENIRNI